MKFDTFPGKIFHLRHILQEIQHLLNMGDTPPACGQSSILFDNLLKILSSNLDKDWNSRLDSSCINMKYVLIGVITQIK